MVDVGPAEVNFGNTALLSGERSEVSVLILAYAALELAPPREAAGTVDLEGVGGTVVVDKAGTVSVRFTCGDLGYDITALDVEASPIRDPAPATDAALSMRRQLDC